MGFGTEGNSIPPRELICARDDCDNALVADHPRRIYCDTHKAGARGHKRLNAARPCARPDCAKTLPVARSKRAGAKYCSDTCRKTMEKRRSAERRLNRQLEGATAALDEGTVAKYRRGATYKKLNQLGLGQLILDGSITQAEAAAQLSTTEASVSRAMRAVRFDTVAEAVSQAWEMDPTVAALFPREGLESLRQLGLDRQGTPIFDHLLNGLVEIFIVYQHTYWTIGSRQEKMIIKGFHEEWIAELILAWCFGLRVHLLTTPRHGKTEIIMRFCLWLIVMYPNVQILWIGASTKLAKQMCGGVKDHLSNNRQLILDTLGPRGSYEPALSDRKRTWGTEEFTVATRTAIGLKSPTLQALGATSTVAGNDVDFLVVDDLEERKTVAGEEVRATGKKKFAEIGERKEPRTAFCVIGSRQHPDDIPHSLMESPEWKIIERYAHDESCGKDPDDWDIHTDCMLIPEIRDYRWLMEQKSDPDLLGIEGQFELRYLGIATGMSDIVFRVNEIRSKALDKSRGIGRLALPAGRPIAGIDPASRATQAAFGWLWTPQTIYMIDSQTQEAGGFAGAFELIEWWYQPMDECLDICSVNHEHSGGHDIDLFIYEDNSSQIEFFRDPRFYALKQKYPGLKILQHNTGNNKHDPELGLTATAPFYHSGRINLPYGTVEARQKVNQLLRQLQLWTSDGYAKKGKSDVKMSSWFPFPRMLIWDKNHNVNKGSADREMAAVPYPDEYAGLRGFTDYDTLPWSI